MLTAWNRVRRVFALGLMTLGCAGVSAQRVQLEKPVALSQEWTDSGLAAASSPVQAVILLKPSDAQTAQLDQLLLEQQDSSSTSYRKFLTPLQYATRFVPDATVTADYFRNQGFQVTQQGQLLLLQGTVATVQAAFATQLDTFVNGAGQSRIAVSPLSVPDAVAGQIASVEGVSQGDLSSDAFNAWSSFAASVEANTNAVMTLQASAICNGNANALAAAYIPVLKQAAAQGITVLVSGSCVSGAYAPAATAYVTAVHASTDDAANTPLALDDTARPSWQVATGLPTEAVRAVPDLSVSGSVDSLAQALSSIVTKSGTRQGVVNTTLYQLSAESGIYDQPVSTWQQGSGLGTVNLESMVRAWPLGSTGTNTSIVSSNYSPTHGASFTLTATVAQTGSSVPTGTVTFSSAASGTLGNVSLSNGQATYTTNTLAGGAYSFYATYAGDSEYASATSGTATVTIQAEETSISATTTSTALGGNIPVVVTATASSGVGYPTGNVTVQATGTASATTYTGTLAQSSTNSSTATVSVPATAAGSQTMVVKCSNPSASFACNTSTTVTATVTKGTPTATLNATAGTGGSYTLTATVTGLTGYDTPTGNVEFLDGGTVLTTVSLSNGTASTTTTFTGTTSHSLTVAYLGDNNYNNATSAAVTASGTLVSTTTSLTSDKYTGVNGTTFTLISIVSPSSLVNSTLPTGTITFTSSLQGTIGSISLSNYSATLTISSLQTGTHTITATYSGDGNYAASTSMAATFTVTAATGNLTATLSPSTSIGYGTTAVVNATVTTSSGTAPSGTVQAVVNGSTYTGALVQGTSSSTAAITIASPPPGTYPVVVSCVASTLTCSNTVTLSLTVVKGATATTLTVTPAVPTVGSTVTFSASVAPSSSTVTTGLAAITGTVTFTDNGVLIGTGTISNGTATVTGTLSGSKAHAIVATYSGDTNWASSASSAQTITPTAVDPTMSVSASNTTYLAGASVILTATVTQPSGIKLIPSGTVTFYDSFNGALRTLGTATLSSNGIDSGVATLISTNFTGGTHNVYASYSGDTSFNAIKSSILTLTIGDFALTINPTALTINKGSSELAAVIVTTSGFSGDVSLSCTPPGGISMTCSVSPNIITTSGTATITITSSTTSAIPHKMTEMPWQHGIVLALLLGLGWMKRRSRVIRNVVAVAILLVAGVSMTGCADGLVGNSGSGSGSGSGGSGSGSGGTPYGSYIFTVTGAATDGSTTARHSYSFQVTVQ